VQTQRVPNRCPMRRACCRSVVKHEKRNDRASGCRRDVAASRHSESPTPRPPLRASVGPIARRDSGPFTRWHRGRPRPPGRAALVPLGVLGWGCRRRVGRRAVAGPGRAADVFPPVGRSDSSSLRAVFVGGALGRRPRALYAQGRSYMWPGATRGAVTPLATRAVAPEGLAPARFARYPSWLRSRSPLGSVLSAPQTEGVEMAMSWRAG
jgi:hypothetical protein